MNRIQKVRILVVLLFLGVIVKSTTTSTVAIELQDEISAKLVYLASSNLSNKVVLASDVLTSDLNSEINRQTGKTVTTELKERELKYKNVEVLENINLDPNVIEMIPRIEEEMVKNDIDPSLEVWLLALLNQESHGKGNDPFQVSEAYCGKIGCIKDRDLSIQEGVKEFKKQLNRTYEKLGVNDIKTTLQGYNFGPKFVLYLQEQKSTYTEKLAHNFSKKMCGRAGTRPGHGINKEDRSACYGDFLYVPHIERYIKKTTVQVVDNSQA